MLLAGDLIWPHWHFPDCAKACNPRNENCSAHAYAGDFASARSVSIYPAWGMSITTSPDGATVAA